MISRLKECNFKLPCPSMTSGVQNQEAIEKQTKPVVSPYVICYVSARVPLPSSAWADGKLAELAEQLGKMVEHPKSKSTQPRFARRCVDLYVCTAFSKSCFRATHDSICCGLTGRARSRLLDKSRLVPLGSSD